MESALSLQLRSQLKLQDKLALAADVLHRATSFDAAMAEHIWAELRPSSAREDIIAWAQTLPPSASSAYLRVLISENDPGAWEHFFSLHNGRDSLHLLAYARALAEHGRFDDAARQLRLALHTPVKYSFFPRAEQVIRTIESKVNSHLRQVRIAILGSSTTSLLIPILRALCLRDRVQADFYQGLYGAIHQETLDPQSGLAHFKPDLVFVMTHWRDLNLPAVTSEEESFISQTVSSSVNLWQRLSAQFQCHVVQHAFDFPAQESYGYLASSIPGGRTRIIAAINDQLKQQAPAYVSLLDTLAIQRQTGIERWEDPFQWASFKQHPSTEGLPALAEGQQAHLRAVVGLTRKVLVTDLDNTLWKGVIGEDGLDGIQIGPGSAAGEAHQHLQNYLKELESRGILLAVCSKNNMDDARLPFEKHPHMKLRLEDFAAFAANWNDKASNIIQIAETLSLGLDSFVFLDDNPLEREWVRTQLPQVAVVESSSVFHYVRDLDRGQYFFSLKLSSEDLARSEQYRSESQRASLRTAANSMDDFLSQLNLEASVASVADQNCARVTQLINKTNQFNLTTKRYTEAQVQLLASNPSAWTGEFHLADRMGNYGLIGVIFCVPASDSTWEIDLWLMSCRVLGRQMEQFMFDRLIEAASTRGIRQITGVFRPTGKNHLVAEHYSKLGFVKVSETPQETRYSIAVPAQPVPVTTHIRDISAPLSVV